MITLVSETTAQNPPHDNLVPRLGGLDDNQLVEQCRREVPHRMDAFRELVTRYEPEVFESCFRLVDGRQAAERICEDAFLQVFHQVHQFRFGSPHSSVRIWIFQIAHRLCELHFENRSLDHAKVPASGNKDVMAEALATLGWKDRSWIVLRFVGGLQTHEIAEIFEIRMKNANEQIYRALSSFRDASELVAA